MKILRISLFIFIACLFLPLGALADELNTYQFSDSGYYVHYEGLVPCGKDVWISEDEEGLNESIIGHVPCQFCHIFIMLAGIISFLLTRLIPILAVGMLLVAGIMYYLALGSPEKLKKANKVFTGVLYGLVLIYGAWLIIGALFSILGVAEWTGLQSGWYKIDCPIKHIVYDPEEIESAPAICVGEYGIEALPGYLCAPGGVFTSTLKVTSWCDAVKTCANLTDLGASKGDWKLPTVGVYQRAKSTVGQFLKCDAQCKSWDTNCCQGNSHGRAYWTINNEVIDDNLYKNNKASGWAYVSWFYDGRYSDNANKELKSCTWSEWQELGGNRYQYDDQPIGYNRSVRCFLAN